MQLVARIDLVRLAQHLRGDKRHPELIKAIDRAAAIGSTREDLRAALESLEQIVLIQGHSTSDEPDFRAQFDETTVIGALFVQAVVLYARATATTGQRQQLLGEAKLTPEQRSIHDETMNYRNCAVAHFGRGETFADGPLVKEAVVLSLYKDGERKRKRIGVYTTRAQHKVAFSARLASLLEVRLAEIEDRYQKIFNTADAALESAAKCDPSLGKSLPQFEFDVDAFCASPEAAARLRAQMDASSVTGMNYVVAIPKS